MTLIFRRTVIALPAASRAMTVISAVTALRRRRAALIAASARLGTGIANVVVEPLRSSRVFSLPSAKVFDRAIATLPETLTRTSSVGVAVIRSVRRATFCLSFPPNRTPGGVVSALTGGGGGGGGGGSGAGGGGGGGAGGGGGGGGGGPVALAVVNDNTAPNEVPDAFAAIAQK